MTNEEKLAVFKAHLDGKPIEYKAIYGSTWNITTNPNWWFEKYEYCAKLEPAAYTEPDWKMRCIEATNEICHLIDKNNQLAEKNRQLQSAYDEMREKTNVLIAEVGVLKRAIQQFHNVTKFALDN